MTGADAIQAAVEKWSLPRDTDYSLVNDTQKRTLNPSDTLEKAGVTTGDVLEVQPVLVAGSASKRSANCFAKRTGPTQLPSFKTVWRGYRFTSQSTPSKLSTPILRVSALNWADC